MTNEQIRTARELTIALSQPEAAARRQLGECKTTLVAALDEVERQRKVIAALMPIVGAATNIMSAISLQQRTGINVPSEAIAELDNALATYFNAIAAGTVNP